SRPIQRARDRRERAGALRGRDLGRPTRVEARVRSDPEANRVLAPVAFDGARDLEVDTRRVPAQSVAPRNAVRDDRQQDRGKDEAQHAQEPRAGLGSSGGRAQRAAPPPELDGSRGAWCAFYQVCQSSSRKLWKPAPESRPSASMACTRTSPSTRRESCA